MSLPENRSEYTKNACASRFSHLLSLQDSTGSGGKERKRKTNVGLDPEAQSGDHDDDKGWDKWVLTGYLVEKGLPS